MGTAALEVFLETPVGVVLPSAVGHSLAVSADSKMPLFGRGYALLTPSRNLCVSTYVAHRVIAMWTPLYD